MTLHKAADDVWHTNGTQSSKLVVRRITYSYGVAAEALVRQEMETFKQDAPQAAARPQQLPVSTDGAFVQPTCDN